MTFRQYMRSAIHRKINHNGPREYVKEMARLIGGGKSPRTDDQIAITCYFIYQLLDAGEIELANHYLEGFDVSRLPQIPGTWLSSQFVAMKLSKLERYDEAIAIYQTLYDEFECRNDPKKNLVGQSLLGALVKSHGFGLKERELFYALFIPVQKYLYCYELFTALPILLKEKDILGPLTLIIEQMWSLLAVEKQFRSRECDDEMNRLIEYWNVIDEDENEYDLLDIGK